MLVRPTKRGQSCQATRRGPAQSPSGAVPRFRALRGRTSITGPSPRSSAPLPRPTPDEPSGLARSSVEARIVVGTREDDVLRDHDGEGVARPDLERRRHADAAAKELRRRGPELLADRRPEDVAGGGPSEGLTEFRDLGERDAGADHGEEEGPAGEAGRGVGELLLVPC